MCIIPFFLVYSYSIIITLKSNSVPITATFHSRLPPDSCKNLLSIYMNWPFWIVHRNCHTLCVWLILVALLYGEGSKSVIRKQVAQITWILLDISRTQKF